MSISTIAGSSAYMAPTGCGPRQPKELDDLQTALESGDLAAAQQALAAFQQHLPGGGQATDDSGDGVIADISALGKALAAGDLTSAQNAYSSLQAEMQNNLPPPPKSAFAEDMAALVDALSSGDLSAAQDAFAQLQDDLENNPPPPPSASGDTGDNDTIKSLFDNLSDALESGDVDAAQDAFAALLEQLKALQEQRQISSYSQIAGLGASSDTSTVSVSA